MEEHSADNVKRMFETNVFGFLNVTRAVLPHMRGRQRGHLMNIASVAGYDGYAGFGVYSGTKLAVEGLSEALHLELRAAGRSTSPSSSLASSAATFSITPKSLVEADIRFADYDATAGAVRAFVPQINHDRPGDSVKLAYALMELAGTRRIPRCACPSAQISCSASPRRTPMIQRERESWRAIAASADVSLQPRLPHWTC